MKYADTIHEREVRFEVSPESRKAERGIVLVVVLVLSAVTLMIMTALIYMVTSGTQISGFQKRYKTSLEAARGGSDVFYQIMGLRGDSVSTTGLTNQLAAIGLSSSMPILTSTCAGTTLGGTVYANPWQAKLFTPSSSWTNCSSSLNINPADPTTYDMRLVMGTTSPYNYYAKIVNTVEGNSGGDLGLLKEGVVSSGTGEITVQSQPYLYAIEVEAENSTNTSERAKFSILYQY